MQTLVNYIDRLNEKIGHGLAWVALVMVLVQFIVVVMRYVFAIGNIAMQESIWYMHGIIFMIGAGYTLLHNGHVRVDIVYGDASPRYKAWVDLLGTIFLLIPITIATFWLSFDYVINSWKVWETSTEMSGLPLIWAYKTVIWIFALLLFLQAISLLYKSWRNLRQPPPPAVETGGGAPSEAVADEPNKS